MTTDQFSFYLDDFNRKLNSKTIRTKKVRRLNKDKNQLVTIILVTKNSSFTLQKSIESIVCQDYRNIEFLIIDGGSSDDSLNIISKYDKHINFWISGADKGPADAANLGIAISSGKYIFLLASDDWIERGFITKAINSLERNKTYFVYGDLDLYTRLAEFKKRLFVDLDYKKYIEIYMPSFYTPSMVFNKKCFEICGLFDIRYKIANDYDFLLRLHKSKIDGIYEPGMVICHRLGGISNKLFISAHYESMHVALAAGGPILKIFFYFVLRFIKAVMKFIISGLAQKVSNFFVNSLSRYKD
jgi:glycosyltransferase involved in cell wall biosynthesis